MTCAISAQATAPAAAPCEEPPKLVFDEAHARFADAYQYGEVVHRFDLANRGERPVAVRELLAVAGGADLSVEPKVVAPGGRAEVVVRQKVGGRLGRAAMRYALFTDEPCVERYRFTLTGFIESAFDPERPAFEFGLVDRVAGAALELELGSREVDRLEVTEVAGAPAWLTVEAAGRAGTMGESLRLVARVAPGAPAGLHTGTLRLTTNVPVQRQLDVTFRANLFGTVTPSLNPIDLGLVRQGERLTAVVDLRRRGGGEAPEVTGVATPEGRPEGLTWTVEPCPTEPACTRLSLAVPGQALGAVVGRVEVAVAGGEVLPLEVLGRVVAVGTEVRPLALPEIDPAAAAEARPLPVPATLAVPAPVAPGTRPTATLRWTSRDEKALWGYLVYRADRREGPFRRVSATMIPVPQDGAGEHSYVFVDDTVEPCRTYYYFLDYVTQNGLKVRFSGVGAKVVACPEGAAP